MKRISLIAAAAMLAMSGAALAGSDQAPQPQQAQQAQPSAQSRQAQLEAARKSPAYKSGYSKGCDHAMWGTGPNHPRSDKSDIYKYGWVSGYNNCQRGGAVNGAVGMMSSAGAGSR
jgi:hypothetical protein